MKSDEALAAEQTLEAKLADIGVRPPVRNPGDSKPAPEPVVVEEAPAAEAPAAVEEPVEAPAAVEEIAAELAQDPTAAAVLAKYGNDPTKVAQALAHAQRKLGQQGSELGDERQKAAEYETILTELQAMREQQAQPQQQQFVDQSTADWFDQQLLDDPVRTMEWARQNNNQMLYQRGISTWKDVDPYGASRYANAVDMQALEQRLASQRPTNDSVEMQSALNQVLSTHQEFVQYADDLPNVIERYPLVAAGLSGGQEQKQQAIETLFALAERDTLRSLALTGATPVDTTSSTAVAVPATAEQIPDEEAAQPSAQDQFREQFRKEAERYGGERVIPGAYVAR